MFDGRFRGSVDKRTGPLAAVVRKTGLTADHLTALGVVMAVVTAVVIGTGHLFLGFVCVVLSGVPDLLDGPVAKVSGTSSVRGAFFDSTIDRITDALVLGGIAWYLEADRGSHWGMLPFAVLGVSTLISYMRAKGELLGFDAKGGLMERAERVIALCIGLAVPFLLVPVLWLMLALTSVTAVQRFVKIWRQATVKRDEQFAERGTPIPPRRLFKAGRDDAGEELTMEARWLAWREANRADRAARSRWSQRTPTGDAEPIGARWRERREQRDAVRPRRPRRTRP